MRLRKKRWNRRVPKYKRRHHIGHRIPELKWYRGVDEDWGEIFCQVRTENTPHFVIRKMPGVRMPGYCGFDLERGRFAVRPWNDKGIYNLGWRKKAFAWMK